MVNDLLVCYLAEIITGKMKKGEYFLDTISLLLSCIMYLNVSYFKLEIILATFKSL